MSLVETWIEAAGARGLNLTAAVEELNRATKSRYTVSRVGEWRNGKRLVPTKARAHMLREALPIAFEKLGIRRALTYNALADLLT